MTTTTASDPKGLPDQPAWTPADEEQWSELEAAFARGCGDAVLLVSNRHMTGRPCTPDFLDAMLAMAEQQCRADQNYWLGYITMVRICQARLASRGKLA